MKRNRRGYNRPAPGEATLTMKVEDLLAIANLYEYLSDEREVYSDEERKRCAEVSKEIRAQVQRTTVR